MAPKTTTMPMMILPVSKEGFLKNTLLKYSIKTVLVTDKNHRNRNIPVPALYDSAIYDSVLQTPQVVIV